MGKGVWICYKRKIYGIIIVRETSSPNKRTRKRRGQVAWVYLKGLPCGDLSIINIYVPNYPIGKENLWELLKGELPRDCEWILCVDLDMMECLDNKSSQCKKIISKKELFSWEVLKNTLDVQKTHDSHGITKEAMEKELWQGWTWSTSLVVSLVASPINSFNMQQKEMGLSHTTS